MQTITAYHKHKIKRLGALVRELREMRDWTREEFVERVDISRSALEAIESGERRSPEVVTVVKIARAFDLKAADLLDDVNL